MDWVQTLALVLSSIGAATIIPKLIDRVWHAATGRSAARRRELDTTRAELDREAAHRRLLQEALSQTRQVAFRYNIPIEELPAFPSAPPIKGATST